jgi:BirA family biotin operon repressor/biotin-[acetyl-CoA-carboxylase] ligase
MWNIETFAELDSTQKLARERLANGTAKHGNVFVALHQTAGKGRYPNRIWHDEPGTNLLMSIILTKIPDHLDNKMQFIAALAVVETVRTLLGKQTSERVQLKWTNDILIDKKKVSGIVSEAIWTGSILKGVIIGIGINVNQVNFSDEISGRAISLKHLLHHSLAPEEVRDLLLEKIENTLRRYPSSELLMTSLRTELEWMRHLENISLIESDGTKAARLRYDDITDDGALQCRTPDGSKRIYHNATLTIE